MVIKKNLDGHKSNISTRPKAPKTRKHSSGILILITNIIAQGIKVVKSNSGGCIWLKLDMLETSGIIKFKI